MKVGIAFNTKGKPEQVQRVRSALGDGFHLWNFEGGQTSSIGAWHRQLVNVAGGPDYAAVLGLTELLNAPENYTHVGLVEDDVLMLDPNWFDETMALFEKGAADGLEVGAVSARAYDDRILIQRDGYALMHNLGYGMIIMTREAAVIALDHVRTGMTSENRRVFCKLSGLDIGKWWAFKDSEHMICADWGLEKFLAMHGLASLALTPSPVEMVGQVPPLEQQGLRIASEPLKMLEAPGPFTNFVLRAEKVRKGQLDLGVSRHILQAHDGNWHYYPHQFIRIPSFGQNAWGRKWNFEMGPFALRAIDKAANIGLRVSGPVAFFFTGGPDGGKVMLEEPDNKKRVEYHLSPESTGQGLEVQPSDDFISSRGVRIVASLGVTLLRMRTAEQQMLDPTVKFDVNLLPPLA